MFRNFRTPLIAAYAIWILWCLLMKYVPEFSEKELIRGIVRICAILIPSLLYLSQKPNHFKAAIAGLSNNNKGFILGMGFSTILLALFYFYYIAFLNYKYVIPNSISTWLNIILFSPLAEELLFRSIIFQELQVKMSLWKALLLSSLLFVGFHFPSALIVDGLDWQNLLIYSGQLMIMSVLFTLMFWKAKSIWASYLPHSFNNLFSEGLVLSTIL